MKKTNGTVQDTRTRRPIILAGFVVLAIGITTSALIYGNTRAPFRATVLKVNDTSIKMRYFLKRVYLARTNPRSMLQTLANEEIIKQTAPQPPYSIKISDEEIDRALEETARRQGTVAGKRAFNTWYHQQLEQTGFSTAEYRDLVRTNLLTQRLIQYLAEKVPTVAEQVHLYMIGQNSMESAREVKRRLEAGEDFYTLARDQNVDEELRARGGDLGWYPRNGLAANLAQIAFNELELGQASEPLLVSKELVAIIMVGEKAAARQIDDKTLQQLKSRVLEDWLQQEYQYHRVVVQGLNNGFNAETEAWVQWQIQKMMKE